MRLIGSLLLVLLTSVGGYAQTSGALAPWFAPTFLRADGAAPLSNGFVCTFAAGTTTPLSTYSDYTLMVANQNPIRLNTSGQPVNGSTPVSIYLTAASYKFVLRAAGGSGSPNCGTGAGMGAVVRTVDNVYDLGELLAAGLIAINSENINNIRYCNAFPGATAGAKITACLADLPSTGGIADARGIEGVQVISSNINIDVNQHLILGAATFSMSATFLLSTGSSIEGVGPCRVSAQCTTLIRSSGTTSIITATGGFGAHVNNFSIKNLYIDGGSTAGHGIVLDYVDGFRIVNVVMQHGGASNALRLLDEAWDFWVENSVFAIWGDGSTPTIQISGLDGSHQITDGHWVSNQLGEVGNGNPILIANGFVLQQRFVDDKFHTTGGTMPYMVDWTGYRSDFIGCSFQADTASSTGGLVRIKNADNAIVDGIFNDINNGVAIQVYGAGDLVASGNMFRGTSTAAAIKMDATSTGNLILTANYINGITTGYDIATGSGTVSIGPTNYINVSTHVNSTSPGANWVTFDMGNSGISGASGNFTNGTFTKKVRTGDAAIASNDGDVVIKRTGSNLGALYFDDQKPFIVGYGNSGGDKIEFYVNNALKMKLTGTTLTLVQLPAYANNAAAIMGGLVAGDLYRTGGDPDTVAQVH